MKLIFRFMKKYWHMALLASAFMIGEVFIDLLQPRMMVEIVNSRPFQQRAAGYPHHRQHRDPHDAGGHLRGAVRVAFSSFHQHHRTRRWK